MKQYRTVNNLVGWITFIIAATVYCMTIEPTASFWDCPEFITTGYKLDHHRCSSYRRQLMAAQKQAGLSGTAR